MEAFRKRLLVVMGNTETLYVRVNLYTNDTESEDPEGNPCRCYADSLCS